MEAPWTAGPSVRELMAEPRVGRLGPRQDRAKGGLPLSYGLSAMQAMLLTIHSRSGKGFKVMSQMLWVFMILFDLKFKESAGKFHFK